MGEPPGDSGPASTSYSSAPVRGVVDRQKECAFAVGPDPAPKRSGTQLWAAGPPANLAIMAGVAPIGPVMPADRRFASHGREAADGHGAGDRGSGGCDGEGEQAVWDGAGHRTENQPIDGVMLNDPLSEFATPHNCREGAVGSTVIRTAGPGRRGVPGDRPSPIGGSSRTGPGRRASCGWRPELAAKRPVPRSRAKRYPVGGAASGQKWARPASGRARLDRQGAGCRRQADGCCRRESADRETARGDRLWIVDPLTAPGNIRKSGPDWACSRPAGWR